MDKTVFCSKGRNTIKTDLILLLGCLKFQMKCPELQKQALLTIHSICEKREETLDLLTEMGGAVFVYNLSKSSIAHTDVKEAALFTLGTLAEANVSCKSSLCRKETFVDLAGSLMKEDIPLTRKRVSVYLLSVLVANNKAGQTLAQTTGCLDILMDLFRTTFPLSTEATWRAATATQSFQLWLSVSSALCGCVNNPQNEVGQRICGEAFPMIKTWLHQTSLPCTEIFQPICSFIAMTVANNSFVQEMFSTSGGLETLTLSLVCLASGAEMSLLSCQLSVIISQTLSACITDNPILASGLAQYGVVSHLFSLLASPHMSCEDRLTVLLTLGHCTEASEKHQSQLVQCRGLPRIIALFTEDTNVEVRKAITFVLQTCKQDTCKGAGVPMSSQVQSLEGDREKHTAKRQLFKPPEPLTSYVPKEMKCTDGERLQDSDMIKVEKVPVEEHSLWHDRCAGCLLPFEEVTSRTFASLLSSCRQSCDMHSVLQEATEHFRNRQCNLLFSRELQVNTLELTDPEPKRVSAAEPQRRREIWKEEIRLTPICKGTDFTKFSRPEQHLKRYNGITLKPLHKGAKAKTLSSHNSAGRRRQSDRALNDQRKASRGSCSSLKKRKDFSYEEVRHLLSGVKTFGFSWNSILWSYPFQPGRTNVDLAKKYQRLMKGKAQEACCA